MTTPSHQPQGSATHAANPQHTAKLRHTAAEVTVRAMRPSDLRRITELEQQAFGVGAWTYGMLESELCGPSWYIVAVRPGTIPGADRVIGYAGLQFDGENADIATIAVAPEAQKQGVGRVLMDALFARSRELEASAIFLDVAVNNERAISLYTKYGFEQVGLRKRYYQPENLDAFVMRIELENQTVEDPRSTVFISAGQLAEIIDDPSLRVLDVRWKLGSTDGREQHEQAHIPGAIYVDLETELATHGTPDKGRHPMPSIADFEHSVRSWGVTQDATVVVYDDAGGTSAARLWWMLRNAGLTDVRILDGGIKAWITAGEATESGLVFAVESFIQLTDNQMPQISIDQAAAWPEEGILIDARAAQRFTGETEPIDPRAGHIPGAINVPTMGHLTATETIKPRAELIETFIESGVIDPQIQGDLDNTVALDQPVAVYCGSGVTAAHEIAVLASLGIEASLFPGSWSQWSNDPTRPAVTGAE